MVIVKIMGGLGNQMFQYAAGKHLALKWNTPLFLDLSDYNVQTGERRKFSLDHLNVEYEVADSKLLSRVQGRLPFLEKIRGKDISVFREPNLSFTNGFSDLRPPSYLKGYWQNENYFSSIREKLLLDFTPRSISTKLSETARTMNSADSMSIHIRRGDFLNPKNLDKHGVLPLSYYSKALDQIADRWPHYRGYVFTDDPSWVKSQLGALNWKGENFQFVSDLGFQDWEELYLMNQARCHILANSSFSWWGAWLSRHQGPVYAPQVWYKGLKSDEYDIVPPNWTKLA